MDWEELIMSDCVKCGFEEAMLDAGYDWWDLFNRSFSLWVQGYEVKKVEAKKPDDSLVDLYGEYPQGYEGQMWMVFQIGDQFFRKMGTVSSYGAEQWDGPFREVFGKLKTVTVFESA
jgi:hypothetical protein